MRIYPALFLGLLASCAAMLPHPVGSLRIIRDRFGIPHVYAEEEAALFFGAGYAQAQDQIRNLARNYLRAAGRFAEVEGGAHLDHDRMVRAFNLTEKSTKGFADLDPEIRAHFIAFAKGINAFIRENRRDLPNWIEDVAPENAVALALYTDMMFTLPHCERDLRAANVTHVRMAGKAHEHADRYLGSNQFAVSPERSETGAAMLSMDPHLPLEGWGRWYEMHLSGPNLNVMGATIIGLPYVVMGHNGRVAWSVTVNNPDLGDVFALKLNPGNPLQFSGPNGMEAIGARSEDISVRTPSGMSIRRTRFLDTRFGPIIATGEGTAYAFALPELANLRPIRQLYDMAKSANIRELRKAISIQGLALFNILAIDSRGDSYFISSGRIPIRDTRISSYALRPAEYGWAAWQGFHPMADLPQTPGDHTGFMLNTNSGPESVNKDPRLIAKHFPAYMTGHEPNSRSYRLRSLLSRGSSVSWEEMQRYATDTTLPYARALAKTIANLVEQGLENYVRDKDKGLLKDCGRVLVEWSGRTDIDSRGAIFCLRFTEHPEFKNILDRGIPNATQIFDLLLESARQTIDQFGSLDAPWGDYSRIRRGDIEMPMSGHGGRSISAVRPTRGRIEDGKRIMTMGSSYGMIVDFSGKGRAVSCLPFGESEDPRSQHFSDQLEFYTRGKFKPAWFHIEDVEANMRSDHYLNFR